MRKISDCVQTILQQDEVAQQAMAEGILNLSAYAQRILPQVKEMSWKEVTKGSVVVALSRLAESVQQQPIKPDVTLDDISVKSPLCDITYEKTRENMTRARALHLRLAGNDNHFMMITQGVSEITIIAPLEFLNDITEQFSSKPKSVYTDLVGVTVRFAESYLSQPNVIFTIMATLAARRINIIEVVSTFTELSVIVRHSNLQQTLHAVQQLFPKNKPELEKD